MNYKKEMMKKNKKLDRNLFWPYNSESQWDAAHSPEAEERRRKYKKMSFREQMDYHERRIGIYR